MVHLVLELVGSFPIYLTKEQFCLITSITTFISHLPF